MKADKTERKNPKEVYTARNTFAQTEEGLVNVAALKAKLAEVGKLDENLYTKDSWKELQDAVKNAEAYLENGTKDQVDKAVSDLENAVSSGLKDAPIRWLVDDCVKFVEREIRRGNHYDAIIMDPPSYGRGPKGEIWKIEDSIHSFIKLCTKILSDDPLFFLVNSYTTGLAPAVLTYMLSTELAPWNGTVESQEIGLPVTESGLILPCGASGRWESK